MGRRADDYHMTPGGACPPNRTFTWDSKGNASCDSCGRTYPDHVRCVTQDAQGNQSKHCIICGEDHAG